jgi:hypothetical protein
MDGNTADRVTKAEIPLPNGALYQGEWLGEMRDGWGV